MTDWLLVISLFLHLVATVVWIGGLLLMSLVLWPEIRRLLASSESGSVLLVLLERWRKRFYPLSNLSLAVLIVTGLYQMDKSPHYEGLFQFTNDWSRAILLKHIAAAGMIGIGLVMQWGVLPALERATLLASKGKEVSEVERWRRRERRLTLLNAALGVFVLICTAVATAI